MYLSHTHSHTTGKKTIKLDKTKRYVLIVQELCESRGGRPGLSVLKSLNSGFCGCKAIYIEPCFGIGLSLSLICQPISEDIMQHYLPTYLPTYLEVCSAK